MVNVFRKMYLKVGLASLYLFVTFFLQPSWTIDKSDFYDYSNAQPFGKQSIKLESPVPYPHWSDAANVKLDFVSSGIARLSGFGGTNTLDVLVYATKLPFSIDNIRYEQISAPIPILNDKLIRDLAGLAPSNFTASHVTVATWLNVAFLPGVSSTFQMVFATDGNTTYVMLLIDVINHDVTFPYFPEVDLRYAYAEGTKFKRVNFLKTYSGVSTRTEKTAVAAADNTNCGKAGRWCFRVTDNPITEEDLKPTTNTPVAPEELQKVTNSTGIGLKGAFTFTSISLENNVIIDGNNNDEISIILTKRNADQRFEVLNKNMKVYIADVYKNASSSSDVQASILDYRVGSLVVDYSVNAKNISLCDGKTGQDCVEKVKEKIKEQVKNPSIKSGALSGTIDPKKVEVNDFNECSVGTYCDFNAVCFDFPNLLTFACKCKDGFVGDGFPGNCRPKYALFHYTSIVMYISIVVVILAVAFVTIVFYKVYQNDEEAKALEDERYSFKEPLGWHTRFPYGYGDGHANDLHHRRFAAD